MESLAARHGQRFTPSRELKKWAAGIESAPGGP
jgi:hypothetical protein